MAGDQRFGAGCIGRIRIRSRVTTQRVPLKSDCDFTSAEATSAASSGDPGTTVAKLIKPYKASHLAEQIRKIAGIIGPLPNVKRLRNPMTKTPHPSRTRRTAGSILTPDKGVEL